MAKKQNNVPRPVIRQLYEHCNGGFILFRINEEGLPAVESFFEDPAKSLAVQHYISNWSLAVEAVNLQNTMDLMKEEIGMGDDIQLPPDDGEEGPVDDNDESDDGFDL